MKFLQGEILAEVTRLSWIKVLTIVLFDISVTRTVLSQLDVIAKVKPSSFLNKSTDDIIFSCIIVHNTFSDFKSIY